MYAATGTRPDLAYMYAVHQHCRCLSRPTPELMAELDYVFSYLYENQDVGIRFVPSDETLHGTTDASWEVRARRLQAAGLSTGTERLFSMGLAQPEIDFVVIVRVGDCCAF